MSKKYGRDATIEEISEITGIEADDIVLAIDAGKDVESIYQTVYQSDGSRTYVVDKIAAAKNVCDSENVLDKMVVDQLMDELDENERTLIRMRYYEDKTQMQVAAALGISQVQVSRLEKKILLRMRKSICPNK